MLATLRRVIEHGVTEEVIVGRFRVVTRHSVVMPTGTESIARSSSWRGTGDQSKVLEYSPYFAP